MARELARAGQLEAAPQLGRAHPPRQLEQRERIAAGLGDDAVADAVVEPARDGSRQQGAGVLLREPRERQVGQAGERLPRARLANREHDRHRLRQQPPRDEAEHLVRRVVEPLRVVHEAQQRALVGDRGQQAQHGQRDQEAVGRVAGRQAQRHAQRVALGLREPVEPREHRRAELMDPGERQLHLGLDARDVRDAEAGGLPGRVAQQRRLPDARLAADDQDGALPVARVCEQAVEQLPLAGPAQEPGAGRGHGDCQA